jgi:hypothetical protein
LKTRPGIVTRGFDSFSFRHAPLAQPGQSRTCIKIVIVPSDNEYMARYMNERYHRRRREAIQILGSKCVQCGSVDKLELDHIDPSMKTGAISKLMSRGDARWRAELEKCQLLCAPCHRGKTKSDLGVEHGGGVSGKGRCKCAPCKAKKAEYMRNYYKTRARS